MKNIDLYSYFLKEALPDEEFPEEEEQLPPENPQQAQQKTEVPQQQTKQLAQTKTPFEDFVGNVIENISFSRKGTEDGSVSIKTEGYGRPFIISWVNNRVTLQKPDGTIVALT